MRFLRSRRVVVGMACLAPLIGVVAFAALTSSLTSCRAPTEMTVNVTTDVACSDFSGATITVGSASSVETKAPAATTHTCKADGTVGSLVIVPSGADDDEISIRVVGGVGRDPATCTEAGEAGETSSASAMGCIVSRRAVHFVAHTPLLIDIPLRSSCAGIVCPTDLTCASGACISDVVPEGCGESGEACGEGQLPSDASVPSDGSFDATASDGGGNQDEAGDDSGGDAADAAGEDSSSGDGGDGGDGGEAGSSRTCFDGSYLYAQWAGTGRCGTRDSHSTHPGATMGVAPTCLAGTGAPVTPLVSDNGKYLYFGGSDGLLHGYSSNLTLLWNGQALQLSQSSQEPITGAVLRNPGLMYVTAGEHVYYVNMAGNPTSLPTMRKVTTNGSSLPPVLAATTTNVVTGASAGVIGFTLTLGVAVDAGAWTFAAPGSPTVTSVAYSQRGNVLAGWSTGPNYSISDDGGTVTAQSATVNGPENLFSSTRHDYSWDAAGVTTDEGVTYALAGIVGVALRSNAIAVTYNQSGQGRLVMLDLDTLQPQSAATSLGALVLSAPVVDANDTVFFLTADGDLHAYQANGGDQPLAVPGLVVDGGTAPPPMIGNGAVFVGGIASAGICMFK